MKTENFISVPNQSYVTPSMVILDVQVEGVLCESGISINDWENDDELLDFD